jgi:predicted DNA-binding transcriptional regulator YafY/ketosteroid isomerase-like protein
VADTAGRLLRLLGLLQRQASWAGQELADRLGVDTRTVRRDAGRLRDLGYLVETTPGPGGGYRLGVGSDLPPLLLDDDEAMAVAVVLGISAGAAIPGIERAALATLSRVDRLLPPRLRSQLAALRASTVALMSTPDVVPAESLVTLARACDGHERAMFDYRSRQGEQSDRRVEPHWLVATDRRWYLVAHDLDRRDWRTFRVDRIGAIRLTGHIFEPRPLDDPARLVSESIALAPYLIQARIQVSAPAEEVARRVPADIGVVKAAGARTSILHLGAEDLEWIAGYLVGTGFDFEVAEPVELRDYLAAVGARLASVHERWPAGPGCASGAPSEPRERTLRFVSLTVRMDDATAVLEKYLRAQSEKDLDALVSCWHPAVEVTHPLRPDRSWRGADVYRRQWDRIWRQNPLSRFEVVSSGVIGNRIYLEAMVEHADGTMVPNMNIMEVEEGQIRRARVYTDKVVHDGVGMDDFVQALNPYKS